jgi:adenylate cyclase
MSKNNGPPLVIDLNEFTLVIDLKGKRPVSLHFNTPSRKFYLSLIALVVVEMKRKGKIIPISLAEHLDLLALINETVGGSAGSSKKANLLPRIYRKWKHALPNLEEAPLFNISGKAKVYNELNEKSYTFNETEKDHWAQLFAYAGSEENIRLKFAVDKLGFSLDDIVIIYGDLRNGEAWDRFITHLTGIMGRPSPEPAGPVLEEGPISAPQSVPIPVPRHLGQRRAAWGVAVLIVMGVIALVAWKTSSRSTLNPVASVDRMAFPLPDKPSIAVLPFENLSGDPGQEFFSDGLTEEIITTLSKSPYLFVIARHSTFTYKGKPVKVRQVAEDLGVRYVLEGSVRRQGDQVRITAQLIDALQGHHLWAEKFDRSLRDIFACQDAIALAIMKKLHVKLEGGDRADEASKGTGDIDIYLKILEARGHVMRYTPEDNAKARNLFEEILALDPRCVRAYLGLAISYAAEVWLGTSKSPVGSLKRAVDLANQALALDPTDAAVYSNLAYLMAMTRQYDRAAAYAEKALILNPNSWIVLSNSAYALLYADRAAEAIPLLQREQRMNPYAPAVSQLALSWAYRVTGRYDQALTVARKAVERDKNNESRNQALLVALTGACMLAGREAEGRAAAAELIQINPGFSLDRYTHTLPFKNRAQVDLEIAALRRAGLK